ncbi:MAG TPA: hypothetical protein VE933_12830 [Chitinophagaceae bacterium]|nr:hypothetical protein [Chitinophagaceae bacterium]
MGKQNNEPTFQWLKQFLRDLKEPETNTRKNSEFVFTILTAIIALYFALTANLLATKYGEQQDQIAALKTIVEKLDQQNKKQDVLVGQALLQTKNIAEQLSFIKRNHSNDSLQFSISFLQPNIIKMRKLLFTIQMNKAKDFRIVDSTLSYDVIPLLKDFARDVDEILDNPIFLMHPDERDKCVDKMPHPKVLLESLDFYATASHNYFGEKRQNEYYFKDASTISSLNQQFEELKKQQWDFIWLASGYFNKWYKMSPR